MDSQAELLLRETLGLIGDTAPQTPEFDDLFRPDPIQNGHQSTTPVFLEPFEVDEQRERRLLPSAAVILVIAATIISIAFLRDGSNNDVISDTSTTTTSVVPSLATAPPLTFNRIETWDEFTQLVSHVETQECASGWYFKTWLPKLVGATADAARATDVGPVLRPVADVENGWLDGFVALLKIRESVLASTTPAQDGAIANALLEAEGLRRAASETTNDLVDIHPFLSAAFEVAPTTNTCALKNFGNQPSPLAAALANYFSDAPEFGGFGVTAGLRCMSAAQLRSGLAELAEGRDVAVSARVDEMWTLYEALWLGDAPDEAFLVLLRRWDASAIDHDSEQREFSDAILQLRSDLEAYRDTAPEGSLCPLDSSYSP